MDLKEICIKKAKATGLTIIVGLNGFAERARDHRAERIKVSLRQVGFGRLTNVERTEMQDSATALSKEGSTVRSQVIYVVVVRRLADH